MLLEGASSSIPLTWKVAWHVELLPSGLLTLRIRWPTVISWFPSGWEWAGLCGPRSTRSHPGTVQGTQVSYMGISAVARNQGCPLRRSYHRPWSHPWTQLQRTWPGWACWRCVAAGCPSAGARRRGSLSPDSPPARPRWSMTGSMENKRAADEEESLSWLWFHLFRAERGARPEGMGNQKCNDALGKTLHNPMESHW